MLYLPAVINVFETILHYHLTLDKSYKKTYKRAPNKLGWVLFLWSTANYFNSPVIAG